MISIVAAQVMSEPRKLKREKLQMKRVEEASSHDDESNSDIEPNKIEVHNVPDKVTDDVLKAFFEMDKSGGSDGAIDECRLIRKGVFILTFRDPRGMHRSMDCIYVCSVTIGMYLPTVYTLQCIRVSAQT